VSNLTNPTAPPPLAGQRFRIGEYVRWGDIDLAGIICYGAYVRFFEIAETELFRAIGLPYSQLFDRFDFWLPRVELHFEFRHPALLDDKLEIEMWVARLGRSSLRLEFAVRKDAGDREITAQGHAVLVAVARQGFKSIPLPQELVAALTPYRAA
jgi:acyl-CoA thioester hydrolase